MKKIISLFQRNYDGDRLVRNEVVPGAEWVQQGLGIATRKFDGSSCLIEQGKLFRRYDAKQGKKPREHFRAAQDPDPATGHWPGWVPVGKDPSDQWHLEAVQNAEGCSFADGTYELVGPKVQGNPENFPFHFFLKHGSVKLLDCPTDFDGVKQWLSEHPMEGIVWHHASGDGRMVKIKSRDFGLKWPLHQSP